MGPTLGDSVPPAKGLGLFHALRFGPVTPVVLPLQETLEMRAGRRTLELGTACGRPEGGNKWAGDTGRSKGGDSGHPARSGFYFLRATHCPKSLLRDGAAREGRASLV